jgi:Na+-transporting NADH:ubiquinone oxidoreductase subunit A
MNRIRIKKGIRFNLAGRPSDRIETKSDVDRVALIPDRFPFIRPRLLVKIDDRVRIGSPLLEDKDRPELQFVSPGGGTVTAINYGARRALKSIVVTLDREESHEDFGGLNRAEIASISRKDLIERLHVGGMWPLIRELPFRNIADPGQAPPAIWVNLDGDDPFQARSDVYLKGLLPLFETGLSVLKKLAGAIHICAAMGAPAESNGRGRFVTHWIAGGYPANDPGVLVYHTRKRPEDNRAWYIRGLNVARIADFLTTGKYPVQHVIAVSAPEPKDCRHLRTRIGAPLADLTMETYDPVSYRWITGGIFTGTARSRDEFLGIDDASLMIAPALRPRELFSFLRPGFDRPSHSRAFLSMFKRSPFSVDTDMHGEERACVNCGACAGVCPVDILPQFAYKAILADEMEEALKHGLLDCVECGLCSYVCPSKIELTRTLIDAKRQYYMERD